MIVFVEKIGVLPVAAAVKLPLPLLGLRIGEDPNRKNDHVEAGKLKFLLQCCGRVIVRKRLNAFSS